MRPINWGGLLEPYLQPLKERLGMLPLGQYEDGSVRLAWPGMLADTLAKGQEAAETPIPPIDDDEAWKQKAVANFDVTSLAPLGGVLGAVDNAVGSAGGKLVKGAADLPMDLASRMARAKEMGFDTERTLLHGTRSEFDEFAPSKTGSLGPGVYLTNDPIYARGFAEGEMGRVLPVMTRGDLMPYHEWRKAMTPESGETVGQTMERARRLAEQSGYTGVQYGDNSQVAIFDPRNIRSVNAAFDPARSDSANLLAANAKEGALPGLLANALEQPQGIRAALSANDSQYLKAITDLAQTSGDGNILDAIEWDRGRGYFNPPDNWEAVIAAAKGGNSYPTPPQLAEALQASAPEQLPLPQTSASVPLPSPPPQQGIRAYHGAGFDVPIDQIAMYGTEKPFLWATDNPSLASEYADAAANFGSDYYWNHIKHRYGVDKPGQSAKVYPVEMRFNNPYEIDAGGAHAMYVPWGRYFTNTEEIASSLADMGYDGVVIKNVIDHVSDENMKPGTVYGALRRGTVYSSTTGDLLFGNAPTGSLPGLAAQTQDGTDPQTITTANILKFLRGQ